eukprot:4116974-Amphidinium_carterae.1
MGCVCVLGWEIWTQLWTKLLTLLGKVVSPTLGLANLGAGYSRSIHPTDSNRPSGWLENDFVQVLPYEARAHAADASPPAPGNVLGEAEGGSEMLLRAHHDACA